MGQKRSAAVYHLPPPLMTRLALLLLVAWIASPTAAQPSDPMQPFAAFTGDWEGDGWAAARAGERDTFAARETLRPVLNGTALIMEGSGHDHATLRILAYDAETDAYSVHAFAADATPVAAEVEVVDGQLVWTTTDAGGRMTRWTERFADDGSWVRTGEVSPDGGSRWIPISEITLRRVDA